MITSKPPGIKETLKPLATMSSFMWKYGWNMQVRFVASLLITTMMIAVTITIPLLFRSALQTLAGSSEESMVATAILVLYGTLWLINQLLGQLRIIVLSWILERAIRLLSLNVFEHLHTLSHRFHLDRKTGALTNALERALYGLDTLLWGFFSFLLPTCIEMITVIIVVHYLYGIFYSCLLITITLGYSLLSYLALQRSLILHETYNKKRSAAHAHLVDSLLNFETVRYFNNQKHDYHYCDSLLIKQEKAGSAKHVFDVLIHMGQITIIGVGLLYTTWYSGRAVHEGTLTIGDLVLINGYLLQFALPLQYFGYIIRTMYQGLSNLKEATQLLALPAEIQDNVHARDLTPQRAEIVFDNVTFGYNKQHPILKNVSFVIPAGTTVAVVGATGAGKSTLARLLFRFYDVDEGKILVNGHDIRMIKQHALHKLIGVVPQDTVLFNNTLYFNIAYGCPTASEQDVKHVAMMAQLDSFIEHLPDGYNTVVGERGLKMSGGEKQRIAIARVLLKQPSIYIFDEATSLLDSHTEYGIQKNLNKLSRGTTTLIIAHRLSTISHAHTIIVLHEGTCQEQGTHRELLKYNGLYAQLWHQQQTTSNQTEYPLRQSQGISHHNNS